MNSFSLAIPSLVLGTAIKILMQPSEIKPEESLVTPKNMGYQSKHVLIPSEWLRIKSNR
jgi:hypothetical protein